VPPGEVPTDEVISAATDQEMRDLCSEVMGELMVRGREEHRDHWGPEEGSPGPLVAVDHDVLLRLYRGVHDEMMRREQQRPGLWEPHDDRGCDDTAPP
jgi:hypothetical protein